MKVNVYDKDGDNRELVDEFDSSVTSQSAFALHTQDVSYTFLRILGKRTTDATR